MVIQCNPWARPLIWLLPLLAACAGDAPTGPGVEAPTLESVALTQALNPALPGTVTGSLVGDTIVFEIPAVVTDVSRLVPTFTVSDSTATVQQGRAVLQSGVSAFDGRTDATWRVAEGAAARQYVVRVVVFTGLPVISVYTDGGAAITSKTVYVPGWARVYGGKNHPEWSMDSTRLQVRGRGNSTWSIPPKKPYRLKFTVTTPMLGFPTHRSWVLLANYWDLTLARNAVAFKLSELVGMAYTPRCQPVELVLNGEFQGAYQLCDQVETTDSRVPAGVGGWLLQLNDSSRLEPTDVAFQTPRIAAFSQEWRGSYWVYKTPDPPTIAQRTAIEGQLNTFEANLFGAGFAHPDTGYATYLDVASIIDWYLVQELAKNNDAMFINSVYIYATATGKITFGPLWDFDLAFGGYPYIPEPTGWRIRSAPWIERLLDDRAFIDKLKARWQVLYAKRAEVDAYLVDYARRMASSQRRTHALWAPYGPKPMVMAPDGPAAFALASTGGWPVGAPSPGPIGAFTDAEYAAEVQALRTWLSARFAWLNTNIMNL